MAVIKTLSVSAENTWSAKFDLGGGQPILYGSPRLHHIQCAPGVYYIRLAKDPNGKLLDVDRAG